MSTVFIGKIWMYVYNKVRLLWIFDEYWWIFCTLGIRYSNSFDATFETLQTCVRLFTIILNGTFSYNSRLVKRCGRCDTLAKRWVWRTSMEAKVFGSPRFKWQMPIIDCEGTASSKQQTELQSQRANSSLSRLSVLVFYTI